MWHFMSVIVVLSIQKIPNSNFVGLYGSLLSSTQTSNASKYLSKFYSCHSWHVTFAFVARILGSGDNLLKNPLVKEGVGFGLLVPFLLIYNWIKPPVSPQEIRFLLSVGNNRKASPCFPFQEHPQVSEKRQEPKLQSSPNSYELSPVHSNGP